MADTIQWWIVTIMNINCRCYSYLVEVGGILFSVTVSYLPVYSQGGPRSIFPIFMGLTKPTRIP